MESSERGSPLTEPPPLGTERKVLIVGGIGLGLTAIAAVAGAAFPSGASAQAWVNDNLAPARAILSLLGMLVAGAAITLRPRWFASWLVASATCLGAGCGFPDSWYTFSFAAFVFSGIGAIGALLAALPFAWRVAVVGALPVVHFSGILTAVLSPPPTPELISNSWVVVFRPYLEFAYMNNAYQFYSPDPGAASELWFCIEYETRKDDPVELEALQYNEQGQPLKNQSGELVYAPMLDEYGDPRGAPVLDAEGNRIFVPDKDRFNNDVVRPMKDEEKWFETGLEHFRYLKKYQWIKMPRRPQDRKDPLFQTYYRRLSLTEMVSQGTPLNSMPFNWQIYLRRQRNTFTPEANMVPREKQIPLQETEWAQYILPTDHIQEVLLPSYVRQIAKRHQRADRAIVGIKVYRVLHVIVPFAQFVGPEYDRKFRPKYEGQRFPTSAYDPAYYLPYFVGDFDAKGKLRDPSDPLLYWLIPIVRRNDLEPSEYTKPVKNMRDYRRLYIDYVAAHANSNHMEGELEK